MTSCPHYPANTNQAEQTIQTAKQLLKDAQDPFLALLFYQCTSQPWCWRTPKKLLMGRNICFTLSHTPGSLLPKWSYLLEYPRENDDTDIWVHTDGKKHVESLLQLMHQYPIFTNILYCADYEWPVMKKTRTIQCVTGTDNQNGDTDTDNISPQSN